MPIRLKMMMMMMPTPMRMITQLVFAWLAISYFFFNIHTFSFKNPFNSSFLVFHACRSFFAFFPTLPFKLAHKERREHKKLASDFWLSSSYASEKEGIDRKNITSKQIAVLFHLLIHVLLIKKGILTTYIQTQIADAATTSSSSNNNNNTSQRDL